MCVIEYENAIDIEYGQHYNILIPIALNNMHIFKQYKCVLCMPHKVIDFHKSNKLS